MPTSSGSEAPQTGPQAAKVVVWAAGEDDPILSTFWPVAVDLAGAS